MKYTINNEEEGTDFRSNKGKEVHENPGFVHETGE